MKILVVGDVHISTTSSIVTSRGEKYSKRLENCIRSINWAEEQALINNVDKIIYIGDLFDKEILRAEEVTALQEIRWSSIPHVVLVGNHELGNHSGTYSSAHLMNLLPEATVIEKPFTEETENANIVYLPYIFQEDRKPLSNYITKDKRKQVIVISHNDIAGISYGAYTSEAGFDIEDIKKGCDLFINGHIHNGQELSKNPKVVNIGNLTGQNFSEDSYKYEHHIIIFDDGTLGLKYIENPYAFNFYKLNNIVEDFQIDTLNLKSHSVVSCKCLESLIPKLRSKLLSLGTEATKIDPIIERSNEEETFEILHTNDYLEQFEKYILEKEIGPEDIVKSVLQEVVE